MLRSLDIITYIHLSYLYFMDCSFFHFALRAAIQFLFLTPKIINLPLPPHTRSPVVGIVGGSALCALLHLWEANPAAGELTHGYLHGGLIIDFIGQEGPISKWRLIYVDILIVLLQLLMLTLVITKQGLSPSSEDAPPATDEAGSPQQDVESEERGEIRPPPAPAPELSRLLNDNHSDEGEENQDEVVELERRMFEVTSGELVVASLDVVGAVRRQWAVAAVAAPGGAAPRNTDAPPPVIAGSASGWRTTIARATSSWRR